MRRCQEGFSLIEMIVVIALTSLIGIWAASAWVRESEDAASASMGVWLLTVKEAVDQMLARQSDVLSGVVVSEVDSKAYQNVWSPTLAELMRAGHLAKGFPQRAPLPYDLSIRVTPPKGLCLTVGCKIEALLWAIPKGGATNQSVDIQRIGKILEKLGGYGASVTHLFPQRVRGATLDLSNPPFEGEPPLPNGSIVLQSFHDSTAFSSFIRQGDRRDVRLGARLQVEGQIESGGAITATGPISSASHMQVGSVANPGDACEASGLIAQSSQSGLLVCQGGVWQGGARRDGGSFVMKVGFSCEMFDFWKVVRTNPETGDCSCPRGYKEQIIALWRYPYHYSEEEFHTIRCEPD